MRVVVFGANGNIGRRVVVRLLEEGHHVKAFVHKSSSHLPQALHLQIIQGDTRHPDSVQDAIQDTDVVISTLGSWGAKHGNILTTGMQAIIPAMKQAATKRIISLTGSGVLLPDDPVAWYDHLNPALLRTIAPGILADGTTHLELLRDSDLDWTVVRAPVMKNSLPSGFTLLPRPPLPWHRISRDDVADCLVELAQSHHHIKHAPFIT